MALGAIAAGAAAIPASASAPKPTRIERLASGIATHIAGRPVTVRCDTAARWAQVLAPSGGSAAGATAELAPEICWPLRRLARTSARPARTTPAFRAAYDLDAVAVLTLARESIHLSGIAGANADCLGLHWMPYVAEQLGDAPEDAHAIARYASASHACR